MATNTAGKMPQDVVLEWNPIWSSVVELHHCWSFHRDLFGTAKNNDLLMSILPYQFLMIRIAILSYITMGIGRLLDRAGDNPNKANLSFERLLDTIKPNCSPEFYESIHNMLQETQKHSESIKAWRNKRFGHADKEMALSGANCRLPEIEAEAFEKAVAMMRDMLKEIHKYSNGLDSTMHFPERTGDAYALMEYLRAGHEARQAENADNFL
jgi:hypothetical protein